MHITAEWMFCVTPQGGEVVRHGWDRRSYGYYNDWLWKRTLGGVSEFPIPRRDSWEHWPIACGKVAK